MPDTPSITIVKTFTYRGVPEEWSNRYHFSGSTPSNDAEWKSLADAIWTQERKMLRNSVSIAGAYGYVAGNESSVYQVNYADAPNVITAGTQTGGIQAPGDVAIWVRWKTDQRNTKGRPIYLRKYFHGIGVTGVDTIDAATRTEMAAYAATMTSGVLPGGAKICGPQGAVAGQVKVPTFTTTRTLKRRGADPS